ncbi:MAG: tryptophan-rich sensory protein [Nodosilinea sp.]
MHNDQSVAAPSPGLAIATLGAITATLVVNTLSNIYPPGGQNVGQIANTTLAGVLITPANYAFAIWGLIYLGLIAYGIYQIYPSQRRQRRLQRVNKLLIMACMAQVIWIFLFTLRQFGWSVLAIVTILLCLIGIYRTLRSRQLKPLRRERWLCQIPFSIYLAWIGVATIVNVASALYAWGWRGWGLPPLVWTLAMLTVATLLALLVIWQRQDSAFTLVFVWAFTAIAVRQSVTNPAIAIGASLAALMILLALGAFKTRLLGNSSSL